MKSFANSLKAILPVVSIAAMVLASMSTSNVFAQEYKKIKRMGGAQSVCKGGVTTSEDLQAFVANNPNTMQSILATSGWAGNANDVLTAISAGDFSVTTLSVGTRMAWMGAKNLNTGKYEALPYREWAGKQALEAFQLNVTSNGNVYQFVIPKVCCNLALLSVAPVVVPTPTAVPAAVPAAAVPVVASKSSLALIPFLGAFVGTETRARYEAAWDMDMRDSSGLVGLRAGLLKPITEKTGVFGQVSYYDRNGVNDGNTYPEDNFALDIGVDHKLSKYAFIGGGIGLWNIDDSDYRDASIFAHVGGDIGQSALQWFLEGRAFDSDSKNHDSISDNKMFSLGMRYLIK